VVLMRIYLQ